MELDALLEDYRDDGRLLSEGAFTVSRRQAGRKLSNFRLREPHAYVLNLVSVALATGATHCRLESGARGATVSWDAALTPVPGEEIFDYLVEDSADPLAGLAVAVSACHRLGSRTVEFGVARNGQETVHLWQGGGYARKERPATGGERSWFRMRYGALDTLRRCLLPRTPEARFLDARCGYAPLPVLLGELTVNRGLSSDGRLASCRLGSPPTVHHPSRPAADLELGSPVDGWIFLGFGGELRQGSPDARLHVILNGIDYPGRLDGSEGHLEAYIWSRNLTTDLSLSGIVRDEAFALILSELERARQALLVLAS